MNTDSQQKPLPISRQTPSPCVRNCCLDDADQCLGCGRLLVEILAWGNASEARRKEIANSAKVRRESLTIDAITAAPKLPQSSTGAS